MQYQPLLTIVVPTYNRETCLKLLVTRIIDEFGEHLGSEVELLISNNASTDGTQGYLESLKLLPGIRILSRSQNIGATENFLRSIDDAAGKYLWLIGDDDLPIRGVGASLLASLRGKSPLLVFLRPRWEWGDLARFSKESCGATFDEVSWVQLILSARIMITFVSSWVVNIEFYRQIKGVDIRRYASTNLPHVEYIIELLLAQGGFVVTSRSGIIARAGNSGGYNIIDTFVKYYSTVIHDKLSNRELLMRFYTNILLYEYLPNLIWDVRMCQAGEFQDSALATVPALLGEGFSASYFVQKLYRSLVGGKRGEACVARYALRLLGVGNRFVTDPQVRYGLWKEKYV